MKNKAQNSTFYEIKNRSEEVASLLRQISHPQRLLILCTIGQGEKTVGEIEEACGASQSAVSQFLKSMKLSGLLDSRREGKFIYYKIEDPKILELIKSLYKIFCH
jgi:DNA-binding transcriptional ArsR family regulator